MLFSSHLVAQFYSSVSWFSKSGISFDQSTVKSDFICNNFASLNQPSELGRFETKSHLRRTNDVERQKNSLAQWTSSKCIAGRATFSRKLSKIEKRKFRGFGSRITLDTFRIASWARVARSSACWLLSSTSPKRHWSILKAVICSSSRAGLKSLSWINQSECRFEYQIAHSCILIGSNLFSQDFGPWSRVSSKISIGILEFCFGQFSHWVKVLSLSRQG